MRHSAQSARIEPFGLADRQPRRCALVLQDPALASMNASNSGAARAGRPTHSACHCTPVRKARAGPRSPRPRRPGRRPTVSRPSPSRSTAWWWNELTVDHRCAEDRGRAAIPGASRPRGCGLPGQSSGGARRRARRCRAVLDQRAAAGDVEVLHAAADREHRHVARVGRAARCASSKRSRSGSVGPSSGGAPPRSCRDGCRGRRRGRGRRAGRAAARSSVASGGITTGMPPASSTRPQVDQAERHLVARRLAVLGLLHAFRAPHLGGGDPDQRPHRRRVREWSDWIMASTHVSLAPPPCVLLTTSSPSSGRSG